jgi:AraC-like DNA-binding protein
LTHLYKRARIQKKTQRCEALHLCVFFVFYFTCSSFKDKGAEYMSSSNPLLTLKPKQPEFVLATSDYKKRVLMQYNLAHFYQFHAEAPEMGVIPDACIDIIFCKKDERISARIAGSTLAKSTATTELHGEYFGIRFMPGVNPLSHQIKLSELVAKEENFEDLLPSQEEKERLFDGLFYAKSFEEKIKVFMDYYVNHYVLQTNTESVLKSIIKEQIHVSGGTLKLADLSLFTGYSERYLNKKINEDFGLNPKTLIKIVRFQKAIDTLTNDITRLNCLDTAIDSGYYDQSHFNRDFKKFTGLSPTEYIQNLLGNCYNKRLHISS